MADSKPAAYTAPAAQALVAPITDDTRANAIFMMVSGVLAFIVLGLFGAILTSCFSVSVVLGQAYLPRNSGTASGLIVGFAIGAGGLGVAALGWVADRYGLPAALWINVLMPLAAFVATRFLPAPSVPEVR